METETSSPPAPTGKKRGCLFFGCMTAVVLALVAGVGTYFFVQWVNELIEQYTGDEPLELPVADISAADLKELQNRCERFKREVEENGAVEPLELTAEEINALIQNDPAWEEWKGRLYVEIDERDRVRGQVSIPLGGRFLNGGATFEVSMESGILVVTLTSVEVNGEPLPEAVLEGFLDENLASDLYDDAKTAKLLRRLDKVEVKDGKIRITPRAAE